MLYQVQKNLRKTLKADRKFIASYQEGREVSEVITISQLSSLFSAIISSIFLPKVEFIIRETVGFFIEAAHIDFFVVPKASS